MIRNPVLDEIRNSIHSRPIPWKGLNRVNVVTEHEVQSFESLDKLAAAQRSTQVRSNTAQYAQLVSQLFHKDIRDDLVKYLVLFIEEYGSQVPEFALDLGTNSDAWDTLTKLLDRGDEQITILAVRALTVMATAGPTAVAPSASIDAVYKYTIQHFLLTPKNDVNFKELALQTLSLLLQVPEYRVAFRAVEADAVPSILDLVKEGNLQVQYTALLSLWILSFDKQSSRRLVLDFNVAAPLLDVAKVALKEKIVRVSVALLANLARLVSHSALQVMIAEGGITVCKQLSERKWADEELKQDLVYLSEALNKTLAGMTTFEEYGAELHMKRLRWTPVHRNTAFWMENIDEFKAQDWAAFKELLELLTTHDDTLTLAVACHDIGAIIQQAPEATDVVARGGGKKRLMELIANPDAEVRFEALRATQIMLGHIFA